MADVSKELGIIAQLPGLSTYCIICLGFAVPDQTKQQAAIASLEKASIKMYEYYPWLAGQVVHDKPQGEEALRSSGSYRIAPYDAHDGKSWVHVEDRTEQRASYEEIIKSKAPMSMLDATVLTPYRGIPVGHDFSKPAPVIYLQANLVKNGMILTFNGMHHAFDMTGLGVLINQFAKVLRGESLTPEEVRTGNRNEKDAIPPLEPGTAPDPLSSVRRESKLANPGWAGMPVVAPWLYYRFPASTCAKLKKESEQDLAERGEDVKWISTNDAIVAFFWQSLVKARTKRLDTSQVTKSTMFRPIQGRRALNPPLPTDYLGHIVTVIPTSWSIPELLNAPLASIALQLRRDLRKADDHHFRSLAHLLRNEPDKTTFGYEASMNPDIDIMPSSWADLGLYHATFGKDLGQADFVRRPRLAELMSLAYLMPRTRQGDWDLCISLTEDDVKALDEDKLFVDLVEKIG